MMVSLAGSSQGCVSGELMAQPAGEETALDEMR